MALAGFACGAAWAFIPGYLKAKLNVNEIITTLMLNYIATSWVLFWVFGAWSESGFQMSPTFPKNAWLPRLLDYAKSFKGFGGLTLHGGILFGLIAAVIVYFIIYRSKLGYELRLIGDNPRAAKYAGVNLVRNTVLTMMLSGGLAGLAGMSEVTGVGAPPAGRHLAGLWIYRHHHRMAGEAESVRRRPRLDPLRRPDPGRPRDPALGRAPHAPGHHPVLRDRQRRAAALSCPRREEVGTMLDWTIILQAGIASGTVLLFAALGEILAERSGVLNLGLEGMMLLGAMFAFKMAVATGNPWLGLLVAAIAAGLLALLHAIVTVNFQADQVVSGLAVNFVGVGLGHGAGRRA